MSIAIDSKVVREGAFAVKPKHVSYAFLKRAFDIAVSGALLLLLLPVFLVLAALVRMSSPGPVFYSADRVGLGGKRFKFIKFRSMYVDADRRRSELEAKNEKEGPIFKMKDDPRVTPIGRVLRRYSLDELPQIFSVLTGEMSMVGPRPPLPCEVEQYDAFAMRRLSVKPGITCYWQVMGRSDLTFEEWMELDNRYIDEMSFWNDCRLVLKTPLAVLRCDGAY